MKHGKQVITILLIVGIVFSLFVGSASAFGDTEYTEYNEGWICNHVHWGYDPETKTLTLKSNGSIRAGYGDQPKEWPRLMKEAETIVLAEGVTGIVNGLVNEFEKVSRVVLPDTLVHLEGFCSMPSLVEVTIPDSVRVIGSAFMNCEKLTELHMNTVPEHVYEILKGSGYAKDPSNWQDGALLWKGWVLELPQKSPVIPSSAIGIAVDEVSEPLYIPENIRYIGPFVFTWGNAGFTVDPNNRFFKSDAKGNILTKDGKTLVCSNLAMDGAYSVPEGVETISIHSFASSKITELIMPDSVKVVDNSAFIMCRNLKKVRFSKNLIRIGMNAFRSDHALQSIEIPENVKRIERDAFNCCIGVENLQIKSAEHIGEHAFSMLLSLKTVSLPENLKVVMDEAFELGKGNITEITLPEGLCSIGGYSFHGEKLKKVTILSRNCTFQSVDRKAFGPESLTISGYTGSTAERYASYQGYKFIPLDPEQAEIFSDVRKGDWFYDSVNFVTEQKLMKGVGSGRFHPNGTTTRGMLVTMLHRLAGLPEAAGQKEFCDVSPEAWYADAVNWAAGKGIVNGVSAQRFAPDAPVTREQLAVILMRYAQTCGEDISERKDLSHSEDWEKVSSWAREAMEWCAARQYLSGRGDHGKTWLAPQGAASRAEVAAVFMRWVTGHRA